MPKLKKKSMEQTRRQTRARNTMNRENPVIREIQRKADAEAHRIAREDSERYAAEKIANTKAHRKARQDQERRESERKYDAEARQIARQLEERREAEKRNDAEAHRKARLNPELRQAENRSNAAARRKARKVVDRRELEKQADAKAHRKSRLNQERREFEKRTDAEAHRESRNDLRRREAENQINAEARRQARQNPQRRKAERLANTERNIKRRKMINSSYQYLLDTYNEKIRRAPKFICSCCGGLFYQESTSSISALRLKSQGLKDDFIQSVLYVHQKDHRLCNTCANSVSKKYVPKLCLSNGFDFPHIPMELKGLSPLEERLVALRLPFMQIRLVGSERQSMLRGSVVNVENDLDVTAKVLPLRFNETSTIQVQLVRRSSSKSPYMYETIRPLKVYEAVKYLLNTELYKSENVVLSEDWNSYEDATAEFICDENRNAEPDSEQDFDDIDEENEEDFTSENEVEFNTDVNTNVGVNETLIIRDDDTSFYGVRIAPGEGKTPIPLHKDLNSEILSFPTIYGGRMRKFKDGLRISITDISKSELRRYDRRACKPSKIFYSYAQSFKEKAHQAIQVYLRKTTGSQKLTAGKVRTQADIETLFKKNEGHAVFKNLRNSPPYWKQKTKKVLAMVRQRGKCAFFITFSAAETKWTELLVILMSIVHNKVITEEEAAELTFAEKAELIRSDPVTCIRHFEHRFRALLHLLMKKDGGIFAPSKLEDFFCRVEYQMRGSPHVHGLFWIPDAPIYVDGDNKSEAECENFIDQFITCERCEEGVMENLIGYQIHMHSRTCKKRLKGRKTCRFGFPKPPMERTRILTPLPKDFNVKLRTKAKDLYSKIEKHLTEMGRKYKEIVPYYDFLKSMNTNDADYIIAVRSSIKRSTVFLKRSTNAIFVNPYNRLLLEAWKANMDIQFVTDVYACARYCVGYILKSEGGVSRLLAAAAQDARRENSNVPTQLKKYASILINGSEISAQEAAAFLLGIPNTICSRQDVFINTSHPDERFGILKSKEELEELLDNSEDICVPGLLNHYSQRPKKLENACLAEFASMYEFAKAKKDDGGEIEHFVNDQQQDSALPSQPRCKKKYHLLDKSGRVRKRNIQKIIRFRHYGKMANLVNYSREQLMLFVPWRDESTELLTVIL